MPQARRFHGVPIQHQRPPRLGIEVHLQWIRNSEAHVVDQARYSTDYIVDEFIEAYRFGRRPTGFDIGKGNARLRVYDKLRKLAAPSSIRGTHRTARRQKSNRRRGHRRR